MTSSPDHPAPEPSPRSPVAVPGRGPAAAGAGAGWTAPAAQGPGTPAASFLAPDRRARPAWLGVGRPADWRVLVAAAVAGVLTDIALRGGGAGVGGALLIAALAAGLLGAGRLRTRQAWLLAAAAPVFGIWLALRTSPWLLPLDVIAALGLLVLAAGLARGGSVWDLPAARLVVRGGAAVWHALAAPGYLGGAVAVDRRGGRAALAGIALAVPVVVVLGALLASADPVFASFFDVGQFTGHLALFVLGAWLAGGLLRTAAAAAVPDLRVNARWLDPVAVLVVLGAIDVLFAAFAVAQLIALGEGGARVLETAGLTYAEYARSGFFQLLAVAALTVVTLLALRAWTRDPDGPARRRLLVFQVTAVVLILALVVVAVRRLGLYTGEFGLTMLRLYSSLFSVWVGVVVVLLGLAVVGVGRGRHWLGPVGGAAGLAILLGLNLANPEALVVRHNLARPEAAGGDGLDAAYVGSLSDDAVPAAAAALDDLDAAARARVLDQLGCAARDTPASGWAAANLARFRADLARSEVCDASL